MSSMTTPSTYPETSSPYQDTLVVQRSKLNWIAPMHSNVRHEMLPTDVGSKYRSPLRNENGHYHTLEDPWSSRIFSNKNGPSLAILPTVKTPFLYEETRDSIFQTQSWELLQESNNNKPYYVGIYSPKSRRKRIERFHEKRKRRVYQKRVHYSSRQRQAHVCPRNKGRFVRRDISDFPKFTEIQSAPSKYMYPTYCSSLYNDALVLLGFAWSTNTCN